jgi:hypothetical protein
MEPLKVAPGFWELLRAEIDEWPSYGSRACIGTATSDYALLLARNRSTEESVARLRAENSRLRKEKLDVVQENTAIKQGAHRDLIQAEARLQVTIPLRLIWAHKVPKCILWPHGSIDFFYCP